MFENLGFGVISRLFSEDVPMFWTVCGYVVAVWIGLAAIAFSLWYFVVAPRLARQLSDETADGYLDPDSGQYQPVDCSEGSADADVDVE